MSVFPDYGMTEKDWQLTPGRRRNDDMFAVD